MRALLIFATGCAPILSPPAHLRVGGGKASAQLPYTDSNGTRQTRNTVSEFDVALDGSSFVETPINAETGIVTDFQHAAYFLDAGYMRRLTPHIRVSAMGGGEYWFIGGAGTRACFTLEYVSKFSRQSGSEVDMGNDGTHDKTTTYSASTGSWGIGAFLDVGHRWFDEGPNYTYVTFGLSIRLEALAGIVDFSEQH